MEVVIEASRIEKNKTCICHLICISISDFQNQIRVEDSQQFYLSSYEEYGVKRFWFSSSLPELKQQLQAPKVLEDVTKLV